MNRYDFSAATPLRKDVHGFSPLMWHALAAALLIAVITMGCSSGDSGASAGPKPAMGPTAPQTVAADTSALSPLARTPQAVRDAFANDYRFGATVTKVKHRLMPDGFVHYTINSTDPEGTAHVDEYRADGVKVAPVK